MRSERQPQPREDVTTNNSDNNPFLRETVDGPGRLEERLATTSVETRRHRLNNPFVADRVLMFDSTAAGIPLNTCGRGGGCGGPSAGGRRTVADRYRPQSSHSVRVGKLIAQEAAAVAVARKRRPDAVPDVHRGRTPRSSANGGCVCGCGCGCGEPRPTDVVVVVDGGTAAAAAAAATTAVVVDGPAGPPREREQAIYDDVAPDEQPKTGCCMECVYLSVEMCGCSIM